MTKTKIFGYFLLGFGIILIGLDLASDLIRARVYSLGFSQIMLLVTGFLVAVLGIVLTTSSPVEHLKKAWKFIRSDRLLTGVLITAFAIYALLFFLGKWEGLTPNPELWSDASSVASFAAAYDHPENFTTDALLSNPKNFAAYRLFPLPQISLLTRFTGDYSLSLLILLPVSIFLQLSGFYFLGKKLFRSPVLGLVLSILCAINIQYGAGDYWGFFTDPQPRFMYQAIFPFVLLLFFYFYKSPKFWPLVMFVATIAGYVHFLSSPILPFLVWLGFFFSQPAGMKIGKKLFYQAINIVVYLIAMLPVLVTFFQNAGESKIGIENGVEQSTRAVSSSNNVIDWIGSVASSYFHTLNNHWILIPVVLGLILALVVNKKPKQSLKIISIWIVGILFISFGFPFVLQFFEGIFNPGPISSRLTRELRYTFPLFYLVVLFGVDGIRQFFQGKSKWYPPAVEVLLVAFLVIWLFNSARIFNQSPYNFEDPVKKEISCLKEDRLFCPIRARVDENDVLAYIREQTGAGDKFLAIPHYRLSEQIRYAGLRTSSLSIGDTARLGFSNTDLTNLSELYNEYKSLLDIDKKRELSQFIGFACKLDSDYLLADATIPVEIIQSNENVLLEMHNTSYKVVKIVNCDL